MEMKVHQPAPWTPPRSGDTGSGQQGSKRSTMGQRQVSNKQASNKKKRCQSDMRSSFSNKDVQILSVSKKDNYGGKNTNYNSYHSNSESRREESANDNIDGGRWSRSNSQGILNKLTMK